MTRSKLTKLAHDLHTEPRKHDWIATEQPSILCCTRPQCAWRWYFGEPEPAGCQATDPTTTSGSGDAR